MWGEEAVLPAACSAYFLIQEGAARQIPWTASGVNPKKSWLCPRRDWEVGSSRTESSLWAVGNGATHKLGMWGQQGTACCFCWGICRQVSLSLTSLCPGSDGSLYIDLICTQRVSCQLPPTPHIPTAGSGGVHMSVKPEFYAGQK